jgi:hypothetical protein
MEIQCRLPPTQRGASDGLEQMSNSTTSHSDSPGLQGAKKKSRTPMSYCYCAPCHRWKKHAPFVHMLENADTSCFELDDNSHFDFGFQARTFGPSDRSREHRFCYLASVARLHCPHRLESPSGNFRSLCRWHQADIQSKVSSIRFTDAGTYGTSSLTSWTR